MFCPNCGSQVPSGAASCAQCGRPVAPAQPQYQYPQYPGGPQQPQNSGPQQYSGAQQQSGMKAAGIEDYFVHNIVLTCLGLFCCGCISLILGIIGIVYASNARSAFAMGNIPGAQSASQTAKVLFYVNLVLMALFAIGMIIYIFLIGGIAALGPMLHH